MSINMTKFSVDLLNALHAPVTHQNVAALSGWEKAEGGLANNNPFNTTQAGPAGTTSINSVGVKNYPSYQAALHATVETLNNGYYGGIIGALKSSNPTAFANAVGSSPWGTSGALLSETVKSALGQNFGVKGHVPMTNVGKQRATGQSTKPGKVTSSTVTDPGVTTRTTTGGGVDYKAAIENALLTPTPLDTSGKLPSADLLSKVMANVSSGAYTTPVVNTVSKSGSQSSTLQQVAAGKAQQGTQIKQGALAKGMIEGTNTGKYPKGVTTPKTAWNPSGKPIADWIVPILQWAHDHGWTGSVNSGYRTDAEQTAIYNSGVRPAAVPKSEGGSGSNHEGDVFPLGAVDINGAQQLSDILQKSPYASILVYAGAKDPVHFSHPHDGGY